MPIQTNCELGMSVAKGEGNVNEYWTQKVNEQNEDLKSMRIRDDFKLSLTDKAYIYLKALAYKAGFNSPGELLSSFIGDLTGWG